MIRHETVFGIEIRRPGQAAPTLWKTLFATEEMATAQCQVIQQVSWAISEEMEIELVQFDLESVEACVAPACKAPKQRQAIAYPQEFERWWGEQSPKKRKDDVYAVYCTIRDEMVQEVPSWDFYEAWNLWLQGKVQDPHASVMERVQSFKEDTLSEGASVS